MEERESSIKLEETSTGFSIDFSKNKTFTWTIIAVFAALFSVTNLIGIPGFSSVNQIVVYFSGAVFGPWVTMISYLIGETVTIQLTGTPTIFIASTVIADILYSLFMGYGRNLAKPLMKRTGFDFVKSRTTAESVSFILMLFAVALFYWIYDIGLVMMGLLSEGVPFADAVSFWGIFALSHAISKLPYLPLCIIITESVRKAFRTAYLDQAEPDSNTI
ncbi:MAG: hypothetical protein RTU63_08585 [Candidatus Thorarchaeota archaeon]